MWVFRSVYLLQSSLLATNHTALFPLMVADLIWLGRYSDQRPLRIIQLLQEVKEAALVIEWVLNPSCTAQRAPGCRKHWLLQEALNQCPGYGQLLRYSWHSAKTSILAALPQQISAFHAYNLACRKTWGFLNAKLIHLPSEESGQHCWDLETYLVFCDGGGSISGVDGIICLFRHFTENAVLLSNH